MPYVVYTKSNCKYCDKIKELLQFEEPPPHWVDADKYLETPNAKSFFLNFIRDSGKLHSHYTTFPMVFYDGIFLGGYTETSQFHELDELSKKSFLLEKVRESKP
jgi:glutaredoxin